MAAAVSPLPISVDEYLHSVYEPDVDFVDGALEDRNLGEYEHWCIQRALLTKFHDYPAMGGRAVWSHGVLHFADPAIEVPLADIFSSLDTETWPCEQGVN